MKEAMKLLHIVGEELIKPASPTPDQRRKLRLSFFDNLLPQSVYVVSIFFYNTDNHNLSEEVVSSRLKKSLSETLTRFYPLAGRIQGVFVDSNDQGALFTEAKANTLLSDFLRNADQSLLDQLIPSGFLTSGEPPEKWPLLLVKVSFFRSGGVAIAVCVSHKLCDATSMVTFVRSWGATARGHAEAESSEFTAAEVYPKADPSFQIPINVSAFENRPLNGKKRFVIDASKIAELKSKASSKEVPNPTRVEAVTCLIWKTATMASFSNSGASNHPTTLTQAMDLRRRIPSTRLRRDAIGNPLLTFLIEERSPHNGMEIHGMVTKLRKVKEEVDHMVNECVRSTRLEEGLLTALVSYLSDMKPENLFYTVTSWCRIPFYEADFGWGSPVWVTADTISLIKNGWCVILMDTKDGKGIEAWMTLPEQDIAVFEQDKEFLSFAAPNPTIHI